MVPVLIEMLRFFEDYVPRIESRKALIAITGREVKGNEGLWKNWMEWLVENADEYQPPAGYLEWKIALMSLIDPRFREFLAPAAEGSGINVFEIAWGGVRPDGIPDLQNASGGFGAGAGLPSAERSSLRRVHQRRAQGVSASHCERSRDGQRRVGGRAYCVSVLNAMRQRNRVFRQDKRRANHLRHVGDAVSQQQGNVRPTDKLALEPVHGRAGHRAVVELGDQAGLLPGACNDLGGVGGASSRHDGAGQGYGVLSGRHTYQIRRSTARRSTMITSTRLTRCSRCPTGTAVLKQRTWCLASS